MKRYRHSQERSKTTKIEKNILKSVGNAELCGLRSYDDLHVQLQDLEKEL